MKTDAVLIKKGRPMSRLWDFEIELDKTSKKAVYVRIADALISAIKEKRLEVGDILPGTRKLAETIGVNRNTLTKALDILIAEGWLISKDRVGIFVSDLVHQSGHFRNIEKERETIFRKPIIHVDDGMPNTKISPVKELAAIYRRIFNLKSKLHIPGCEQTSGNGELKDFVSQMLNHRRGMHVNPEEICMTRGSQMALYLTAHCLLEPGDVVLVENPGYQSAWEVFKSANAKVVPVNVDDNGIIVKDVEKLLKSCENVKAIYLTPHSQYPTTVALSESRRLQLIQLANFYDLTLIEDDYDHEFHYDKKSVMPISSHTDLKHYVYIGTFSRIITPTLRIGYLTTNQVLIKKISSLREIIDLQNDTIMELSIVALIKDGEVRRNVKRASKYYLDKRNYLDNLLKIHLKDKISYKTPKSGLAFWIKLPNEKSLISVKRKLSESGIQITSSSNYNLSENQNGFRFGYARLEKPEIEKVVLKLKEVI